MRVSNNTMYLDNITYIRYQSKFDDSNVWIETKERHFTHDRCVYIREYNPKGIFYEEWRKYHNNGEIKVIYNSQGFKQEFNEKGLPLK